MTGEITIHGKVLPIGGLKEKMLAATREGMTEVIIPEKNKAVFQELPQSIRRNLKAHFVKEYNEVFQIMFADVCVTDAKVEKLSTRRESKSLAS
jgi:ATP-dependent Lon protease